MNKKKISTGSLFATQVIQHAILYSLHFFLYISSTCANRRNLLLVLKKVHIGPTVECIICKIKAPVVCSRPR